MSVTVAGRSLPAELLVVAALYALGSLYLLIETLRALPDLGDGLSALFSEDAFGFFFGWVLLMILARLVYVTGPFLLEVAATVGGLLAYRRLKISDRSARLLATAACAVAFVGGFLLPGVWTNLVSAALACYATIVAALWSPPAARAWFGDEPVRLATPGTPRPNPPPAHP